MRNIFERSPVYPEKSAPEPGELDPYPKYWQKEAEALRAMAEDQISHTKDYLNENHDMNRQDKTAIKEKALYESFNNYFIFLGEWLAKTGNDIEQEPESYLRDSQLNNFREKILDELVAIRTTLRSPIVNTTETYDGSTILPDLINQKTTQIVNQLAECGVSDIELGRFSIFLEEDGDTKEDTKKELTENPDLNLPSNLGKLSSSSKEELEHVSSNNLLIPLEEYEN